MRPPRALPAAHFDRNESHVTYGTAHWALLGKGLTLGSSREPLARPEAFRWLPTYRTALLQSGSPPGVMGPNQTQS